VSAMLREAAPPQRRLLPMTAARLDEVMTIESVAYDFPWTRGNFIDGLAAGHEAQLLLAGDQLVGYFVAMAGVEEMHLLNLTVAPGQQGRGHARFMLAELVGLCRRQAAEQLWLEVRGSNRRAHAVYTRFGFAQIGIRKGYYPAPQGQREDAIVMSLQTGGGHDALE
jgi:[ribosomal protein S18]-alanine N-acetyltransferase